MTQITLLTQSNCTLCQHAKQVLDRVARDIPLTVEELDLAGEAGRRIATEAAMLFAPGVLIDGQAFGYGRLSERKLRQALAQASLNSKVPDPKGL